MNKTILKRIEAIEQATQTNITRPLLVLVPEMTDAEQALLKENPGKETSDRPRIVIFFTSPNERPTRPIDELRQLFAEAVELAEKELEANDAKK